MLSLDPVSVDRRRTVSRRAVVRTVAWSVPVVSVVSAAPAYATSGDVGGELRFVLGNSGPVTVQEEGATYYDFQFVGASVEIDGTPAAGAVLSMTVTFAADPLSRVQSDLLSSMDVVATEEDRWVPDPATPDAATSQTFVWSGSVTGGVSIALADAVYFFSEPGAFGIFHVTFSINGLTSDSVSVATGPEETGLRSHRGAPVVVRSSGERRTTLRASRR